MPNPTSRLPVTGRSSALLIVALLAAACTNSTPSTSPAGSTVPSSPPTSQSPVPSAGPTVGAIEHSTGATDVILRVEQGGGFVPIDFLATQAPTFSLYGNGVIVFQRLITNFPQPDASGITKGIPWRTATLDEDQIQELLAFALGPGGLGAARDTYFDGGIADAPSTIFTVRAGGLDKTVLVNALSEEPRPGPDVLARTAFYKLYARLQDFDQGGRISSDVYSPDRFRGVLTERDANAGVTPLAWPWPALAVADFKESTSDGSGGTTLPHRSMTPDEVAELKLPDLEGGVQGVVIAGPNGKTYGLILRPMLADEKD